MATGSDPHEPKFAADAMLGRLARWLRLLGYDTAYDARILDDELLYQSLREGRIVLTRDEGISRKRSLRLILVEGEKVQGQVVQILRELKIVPEPGRLFTRCSLCNTPLTSIPAAQAQGKVPEVVYRQNKEFLFCGTCGKIYWKGTHWNLFQKMLLSLK